MPIPNFQFTDAEKLVAVQREVGMRKRVYPRWVTAGRMTQKEADRQIAIMQEIADEYLLKESLPL